VINILEEFAPLELAQDWDSIGLQAGDPAQPVSRVFLSLDLTPAVLAEASDAGADLLVVHHTPFFRPLQNFRMDQPAGRLLAEIIKRGMALYTAHTNLDATWGGVNDILASKLDLRETAVLSAGWKQKLYKLVVFVPHDYLEQVSTAVSRAGAGWIGNYSDCTFRVRGTGTFRPLEGTNPFIGSRGKLEEVEETRLETIVSEEILPRAVGAMIKAHPYEEVAYDLYPLTNEGKTAGLGRVGRLPCPMTLASFVEKVKEKLAVNTVRCCGPAQKIVEKVAVCGGRGASYMHQALLAGAQVLLTADVKYHEAQEALACDLALVDAGHFATENPVIQAMAGIIRNQLAQEGVTVMVSQICTDPFYYL
jgi:dinuclear metal center YbgI/SA1388 family protein